MVEMSGGVEHAGALLMVVGIRGSSMEEAMACKERWCGGSSSVERAAAWREQWCGGSSGVERAVVWR